MGADEIMSIVSNLGFPIAITVYLLVRFDGMMKQMLVTQEKLITSVEKLCTKIEKR